MVVCVTYKTSIQKNIYFVFFFLQKISSNENLLTNQERFITKLYFF